MLELGSDVVTVLALASTALSVVLLVAVVLIGLRLRKLRMDLRRAFRAGADDDVVAILGRHADELTEMRTQVRDVQGMSTQLRELQRGTLSRLGVVRYDAFEDMGGMLSFSASLLDERGDGLVISAINGRTETRCYAKPISGGTSDQNLSGEERAAIDAAIEGRAPSAYPPEGRRRRRAAS